MTIFTCSVYVIWRLLSPSSCLSVPVITTEPLCQLNLSCYECAIITSHPLRQTHNSPPTSLPTWLLRFIGDIRFRYLDGDRLTVFNFMHGIFFSTIISVMMLKLVVQGISHPFVQLKCYLYVVWKLTICTLWPLQTQGLNSWYSLYRGLGEPKKLFVCETVKCYVTMSKIYPLSSISQLGMLLVLCV
jgi:hypothetical protein